MPETSYIIAVLAIVFTITLALRALPFALLRTLRDSRLVNSLSLWMPVGIVGILAVTTLHTAAAGPAAWPALAGVAVTIGAHLLGGRRTLLSVGLGTLTYVILLNIL